MFFVYFKFRSDLSGTLIHYIKQHKYFLKLSFYSFITFNVFNITCCIEIDSFNVTSNAAILVTIYIVLYLQNKTFLDRVQEHFVSGNCCSKSTKNLAVLLRGFFRHLLDVIFRYNFTFYSVKKCQVHFVTIFLVFLNIE